MPNYIKFSKYIILLIVLKIPSLFYREDTEAQRS